jgi:hypothetical protein
VPRGERYRWIAAANIGILRLLSRDYRNIGA